MLFIDSIDKFSYSLVYEMNTTFPIFCVNKQAQARLNDSWIEESLNPKLLLYRTTGRKGWYQKIPMLFYSKNVQNDLHVD